MFLAGIFVAVGGLVNVVREPADTVGFAYFLDASDFDIGVVFILVLSRVPEADRDDVRFLLDVQLVSLLLERVNGISIEKLRDQTR